MEQCSMRSNVSTSMDSMRHRLTSDSSNQRASNTPAITTSKSNLMPMIYFSKSSATSNHRHVSSGSRYKVISLSASQLLLILKEQRMSASLALRESDLPLM